MARRFGTVDDLVSSVREKIDEDNIESISDSFILSALNRAQDDGMNVLARHYEEPLLTYTTIDLLDGTSEYDIPEDAFEDRVEKMEISISGGNYLEVQRVSYQDLTHYETNTTTDAPYYYAVVGRKLRLVPVPSGTRDARLWYLRSPEELVTQQGRITVIGAGTSAATNYLTVDQVGDDLDTTEDSLGAFVNVVDGQTGLIKGTYQIANIEGNRVKLKYSTPSRTTVYNRTVGTDITGVGIELDDYICSARGTCVPQFARPMTNFLIQYADAEARMKLGGEADLSLRVLEKFEKERVERSWVGRPSSLRVRKRSKHWDTPASRRRHYPTSGN